jgi:methylenetetrahydrofolate dehydrogenase (NADP+)/methenyltetrahydrofolate cyclohydrolase
MARPPVARERLGTSPAHGSIDRSDISRHEIARLASECCRHNPEKPVMSATVIDGKVFAERMQRRIAGAVADLKAKHGVVPGLAVVLVGNDPASEVYVRRKAQVCREVGMRSVEHRLPAETSQEQILSLLARLNADPAVDGILVQLPLPPHVEALAVIDAIAPAKDVDGFHVSNVGRLVAGLPTFVPCTPMGCLLLLREYVGDLTGLEAVVVGRSNIVGKPMAQLLLDRNCTVTIAHSRSRDLPAICRRADILVAAVGRPEMIQGAWVKPGATVIDVGINRIERDGRKRLVGDVHYASAAAVAGRITPVPGGVGPMTIAGLLANTLLAARRARGMPDLDLQAM